MAPNRPTLLLLLLLLLAEYIFSCYPNGWGGRMRRRGFGKSVKVEGGGRGRLRKEQE